MLAGGVTRTAQGGLEAGDRPEVHDVPVLRLAQQWQASSSHPHETEDVGLPHLDPVLVAGLGDRVEAAGEAGVIDENVDAAEFFLHPRDEGIDAVELGHVQGQSHAAVSHNPPHALEPTRAADDSITEATQRHYGGGTDPRRSSGDHRHRPVTARHYFSPFERLSRRRQDCTLGTMLEVLVGLVAGLLVLAAIIAILGPNAKRLVRPAAALRRRHPPPSVLQPGRTSAGP